jgi:hypothetical protein
MLQAGTYKARATQVMLTQSANKGTPGIQINFQIQDEGEHAGATVRYDGWISDKTQERVIESLVYCGWRGDDISVFAKEGVLDGCDLNEVEIVVELEPYAGTDEKHKGKSFPRVAWVNKGGGRGLNVENAMRPDAALAFAAKMKGLVHKVKSGQPAQAQAANGGGKPAF